MSYLSDIIVTEFDRASILVLYNTGPMSVGWYKGEAFVYIWNFRKNSFVWRRFPSHDSQHPPSPPRQSLFDRDSVFYRALEKKG
jgi:hypothetical protein